MTYSRIVTLSLSLVIAAAWGSTSAQGQSTDSTAKGAPRFKQIGLLFGLSESTITNFDTGPLVAIDVKPRASNHGGSEYGAFMTFPVGSRFAIQPEVHFTHKGAKFSTLGDSVIPRGAIVTLTLNYLDALVLARADFPLGSSRRHLFLLAGPSVGIRGDCRFDFTYNLFAVRLYCSQNYYTQQKDEVPFEGIDVGALAGLGYDNLVMGVPLSFQLRHQRGLTAVSKAKFGNPDARNQTFSFLVGLAF